MKKYIWLDPLPALVIQPKRPKASNAGGHVGVLMSTWKSTAKAKNIHHTPSRLGGFRDRRLRSAYDVSGRRALNKIGVCVS